MIRTAGLATLDVMMKRLLLTAAAFSAPAIALTVGSERVIRPRIFYHDGWHPEPPDAVNWPHEEVTVYTPDGLDLQGWLFKAERRDAPTILFCHGTSYNASDMWVTPERADAFNDFMRGINANFFVFDYRGYGRSDGRATEEGLYTDAASALGTLHNRGDIDATRIFYYGFSLGTGIAAELALREPPRGLILRAPFTSVRGLAVDRFPWLQTLFTVAPWLPLTSFDTLAKVSRIESALLVMHGELDKTVPEHMGQRVFEAHPGPKTYVQFAGAGHSDVSASLVVPPITRFVDQVLNDADPGSREKFEVAETAGR
jgi:pimeloyl-ACP methyl ester carboxylesterase